MYRAPYMHQLRLCILILAFGFGMSALAGEQPPVLLEADQLDYDHDHNLVIASGQVSVTQGDMIVLADMLIYDQAKDVLTARGHVSMLEASGNVYFADTLTLSTQMKTGVIEQFKARLSDQSLFAAAQANRINDSKVELFKATYSPCKVLCDDGSTKSPLWQLSANHATIDQSAQEVYYDDATLEVVGIPVFYTPYLSHPTPDAENKSGLGIPEYRHSDTLGSIYKQSVYYAMARDKDITLTPMITSSAGLVMLGEYRQLFDAGPLTLTGSITRAPDFNALGARESGKQMRGDIAGQGQFRINDTYDWGVRFRRVTDDTYLGRYRFGYEPLLTSRLYAQGFHFPGTNDRSYGIIQALAFQGLSAQDNDRLIPKIAPLFDVSFESDPKAYGSRFFFDGGAMSLYTDDGADSRRISGRAGWKIPYITDDGQVIEFATQLRSDIYSVNDVALPGGDNFSGVTGRLMPQASLLWRYPFMNRLDNTSLLIEPIVNFVVNPGGGNPAKIPNFDSALAEFTDTNLFSNDRFAGYDRVESGPRISYGVRGQAQFLSDKYVDGLFGQQYRVDEDESFPISNDPSSHVSDYVGRVGVTYAPLSLAYRFRLDKDELTAKRSEVDASISYHPVSAMVAYLSLNDDPVIATKKQILGSANITLSQEWLFNVNATRDLLTDRFITTGAGLTFANECTNVTTTVGRLYTSDRDIEPSTTVLIRVSLKNLD